MGACVVHKENQHDVNDSFRIYRQGNLTFYIHGKYYLESSTSGTGIKKTASWHTDLTETEITKKITEYWETRIDGSQHVWSILHSICDEPDIKKCSQMLKSAGLNMVNGTLAQVYDERGHRYDLPVFVINKPLFYGKPAEEKKVEIEVAKEFEVVLRMAGKQDYVLKVNESITVKQLKADFQQLAGLTNNVRMFYNGKEMKDSLYLAHFKLKDHFVIIVF